MTIKSTRKKNSSIRSGGKSLSIVIPSYKAEKIIRSHLKKTKCLLDKLDYDYEIICVIDGELDNTRKEANKYARAHKNIHVIGYEKNRGKGHAVRFGMAHAKGDVVGFYDAGFDLSYEGIQMLLNHMRWYNADIIVGSKRHPASKVTYPWQRRIISFGYQMLVRVMFNLRIKDTQVGMKFFRRDVLESILPRLLVKEFAMDIEMLSVANYLGFNKIYEAPIELDMDFGTSSTVTKGFLHTILKTMWDTVAVFYRLKVLHYYDDNNKKNWITPDYLTFPQK